MPLLVAFASQLTGFGIFTTLVLEHNVSGLMESLKGHPVKNRHEFLKLFSFADAAGSSEDIDI